MRQESRDTSRHVICPVCRKRTKLYALSDGRRKCAECDKKFAVHLKSDDVKVKQMADILLCFCLDFPAHKTTKLSKYRYPLVLDLYDKFRRVLAAETLDSSQLRLTTETDRESTGMENLLCRQCQKRGHCKGRQKGDAPIFGVRFDEKSRVRIEPLCCSIEWQDSEDGLIRQQEPLSNKYRAYICKGKMQRFTDRKNDACMDGLESFWSWVEERLAPHHGVRNENYGLYLKELEWKFNHHLCTSETQAIRIAEMLPVGFLRVWSKEENVSWSK